jgi:cytochrome oxidase Cu insertion factor (SCO1/SenC/PrrC family)
MILSPTEDRSRSPAIASSEQTTVLLPSVAPDFTLMAGDGEEYILAKSLEENPIVLYFIPTAGA